MIAEPLRWGVIGTTSNIAVRAVLPAIRSAASAELVAVASRDPEHGRAVAAEFGAARAHDSYEALLADADVEAVYVPLPNALHREWTERAAAAGKHVLCEKPLAPSVADAAAMTRACGSTGVSLVEAFMTPFHPRYSAVLELARSGQLGELLSMRAVFTFPLRDPANHRWRPEMGGGALLDVGIYCLAPLLAVGGEDVAVEAASVRRAPSGVDASVIARLRRGGVIAGVECSFEAPERQHLEIAGTQAAVSVERPFTAGLEDTAYELNSRDGVEIRHVPGADPYEGMVEQVTRVVRDGEPPRHGPGDSLRVLGLVEAILAATVGQ